MQLANEISFAEAATAWIGGREVRLSAPTERAYQGEVSRLAQFFAVKYGGLNLREFTEVHWKDYAGEIQGVRQHVRTCRLMPLSPSSAGQAIRICSAFLRWARDERLIDWAPRMARPITEARAIPCSLRRPLVDLSVDAEPLHPAIECLLMNAPPNDANQEALRAQLALGLAYWGGLRSSDIAALREADLTATGDAIKLRHPRRNSASEIYGSVASTWHRYRAAREASGKALSRQSPVLASLSADQPISAWSVWALIARHIEAVTGIAKLYSAQSLRRARVAAMGFEITTEIDELSMYTRRSRIDFAPSANR